MNRAFISLCRAPACLRAPSGQRGVPSGLPGLLESKDTKPRPPGPGCWDPGPLGAPLLLPEAVWGAPREPAQARGCWLMAACLLSGPGLGSCPLRRPSASSPVQEPTTHFMQVVAILAGPGPSGARGGRTCTGLLSTGALPRGLRLPSSSRAGASGAGLGLEGAASLASPSEPRSCGPRTSSGKALRPGF